MARERTGTQNGFSFVEEKKKMGHRFDLQTRNSSKMLVFHSTRRQDRKLGRLVLRVHFEIRFVYLIVF